MQRTQKSNFQIKSTEWALVNPTGNQKYRKKFNTNTQINLFSEIKIKKAKWVVIGKANTLDKQHF